MLFRKFNFKKQEKIFYLIFLLLFSISFNQYYGNLGVCPIDSFWFFNSGYDVLNGHYPFKDYWTIAGPFIAYTQALLFKIFGVSWFSYVFHASIYNFLISIATFYTFYLTLGEAIKTKTVHIEEISEQGSVPEILFENSDDVPVLLLDGQELIGAKQHRILNLTILVPARSTLAIPVSCVEGGRWHWSRRDFAESEDRKSVV